MPTPGPGKPQLRKSFLREVRSIPAAVCSSHSREIAAQLWSTVPNALWRTRREATVLAFAAMPDEPDLLAPCLQAGFRVVLPRITGPGTMELRRVHGVDDLVPRPGMPKLREPDPGRCAKVEAGEVDVALVPGVAFASVDGVRLGRGGGFYDRLLGSAQFSGEPVGVCFAVQLAASLPAEPHDARVAAIVTEEGWLRPGGAVHTNNPTPP